MYLLPFIHVIYKVVLRVLSNVYYSSSLLLLQFVIVSTLSPFLLYFTGVNSGGYGTEVERHYLEVSNFTDRHRWNHFGVKRPLVLVR